MTRLVDTKTIYAKPHNNPDGASLYHYTAQTLRSSVRPMDNDGDGLLDEDPQEDLDGDGFSRQMRKFVGAGQGSAMVDERDPKGRLMRQVGAGKGDYDMVHRGRRQRRRRPRERRRHRRPRPAPQLSGELASDDGGDRPWLHPGRRRRVSAVGAGDESGLRLPDAHPNVGVAQSLDTSVPMILRGPSTSKSEESMFPEDFEYLKKFDQKGLEITGYPWAGDTFFVYANRGRGGAPPPPDGVGQPLFGHGPEFGYLYYGAIWYGNEIWNGGRLRKPMPNKDGTTDDLELLQWLDANRPGKNDFQPWTKTIIRRSARSRSAAGIRSSGRRIRRRRCSRRGRGTKRCSTCISRSNSRRCRSLSLTSKPGADGAFEVTATVTNEGGMPTALEIAKRVKIVRRGHHRVAARAGPDVRRPSAGSGQAGGGGGGGGRGGGRGAGRRRQVRLEPPAAGPRQCANIGWLKPGETADGLVDGARRGPGDGYGRVDARRRRCTHFASQVTRIIRMASRWTIPLVNSNG